MQPMPLSICSGRQFEKTSEKKRKNATNLKRQQMKRQVRDGINPPNVEGEGGSRRKKRKIKREQK